MKTLDEVSASIDALTAAQEQVRQDVIDWVAGDLTAALTGAGLLTAADGPVVTIDVWAADMGDWTEFDLRKVTTASGTEVADRKAIHQALAAHHPDEDPDDLEHAHPAYSWLRYELVDHWRDEYMLEATRPG